MSITRSLRWQDRDAGVLPANLQRCAAAFVLGLLSTAAIVIFSRRLAGMLVNPLPPAALLAAAMLATMAAAAVRIGWSLRTTACWWFDWAVMAWTSMATLALIGILYLPGTTLPLMVLAAILPAVEETWAWGWHIRHTFYHGQSFRPQEEVRSGPRFRVDSAHPKTQWPAGQNQAAFDAAPANEAITTIPPAEVLQQLTRSRAADGTEELFGWLRLPFAAGQRTGNIHVAFCPPLSVTPEVTIEQIEGPDARIKTAQLLPYGARFDLKLAAAADSPTTVVLQFMARTTRKG